MTASCPICNGKWDIEGEHYDLILRCGDEHDIRCKHCGRLIEFVMSRAGLQIRYQMVFDRYEHYIKDLEMKIKETNDLMEKIKERMSE